MNNGFIQLHKKLIKWEWYKDQSVKAVFLHLLLIANFKDGRFKGKVIKRGQVVTSINHLVEDIGLSRRTIQRCLNCLKETGEIKVKATNKYSVITITKYDDYQTWGANSSTQSIPQGSTQSIPQGSTQGSTNRIRINKNKKEINNIGISNPSLEGLSKEDVDLMRMISKLEPSEVID